MSIAEIYAKTSLGWQNRHLSIVTKSSLVKRLKHNRAQLRVHNTKEMQIRRGFPVRLIVAKARQRGVSTYAEACVFERINRYPNTHGCVVSADLDATSKVFKMCRTFQHYMPEEAKLPTQHSNRKEIVYAFPHASSILCQTAGKEVLGRGGTTQHVHATEVAFWARAEEQLYGLIQEVPLLPNTSIVIESTSFGTTGEFFNRYKIAVDRLRSDPEDLNGYLPVFLSWQDDPEYQMSLPEGLKLKYYRDHEVYGNEIALQQQWGLTPEQMYWRRYRIDNDFKRDLSRFQQEYPATAAESFQGSGRMVFLPSKVDHIETRTREPIAYVEFYRDDHGRVRPRNVLRSQNCWAVWAWPESNHAYCQFGDVAEGKSVDPQNPKSASDRSVSIVLDRTAWKVPCIYYGRPDTVEFGDQMVMAGEFWNWAWSTPEMNSIGQSVLDAFKRAEYPNIYSRERGEDTNTVEESQFLGWRTTTQSRKPMIADLIEEIHLEDCQLDIPDQRVVNEMRTFIINKDGKEEHDVGCFDDAILALAGAIQLHKRCPMTGATKDETDLDNEGYKPMNAGQVAGTTDTELDDDDLDGEDGFEDVFAGEQMEVLR